MGNYKAEYRYEFANAESAVLSAENGVTAEWIQILHQLDKEELNNNRYQKRSKNTYTICSLDAADPENEYVAGRNTEMEEFEEQDMWNSMCRMLSEREQTVGNLYFRCDIPEFEIAARLEITRRAVVKIIARIRLKLKDFSE